MATSINSVNLLGNLTKEPDARMTGGGQAITTFTVATNRTYKDGNGDKKEQTDFHVIVTWGKLAELCGQVLKKGKKVYVNGRLQNREWIGTDGVKKYRTEIIADEVVFLDRPPKLDDGTLTAEENIALDDLVL